MLVEGRKLAGILCETARLSAEGALAIVGIGVNIADRPFPEEIEKIAVSLNRVLGHTADMSTLAARLYRLPRDLGRAYQRRGADRRSGALETGRRAVRTLVSSGRYRRKYGGSGADGRLIVVDDAGKETLIAGGIVESLDLI